MSENGYVNVNAIPSVSNETRLLLRYLAQYYQKIVIKTRDPLVHKSVIFPFGMDDGIIGGYSNNNPPLINKNPAIWEIIEKLNYEGGARNISHQCQINRFGPLSKGAYKYINGFWLKRITDV